MQQQDEPQPAEVQQQDKPQTEEVQQQQQARATATTDKPEIKQQQRPQECGVCLFVYEEQERRPRMLPCGHIFCSLCVAVLLEDGRLTCPSCRTDHLAPSADHFPISYGFEAMVREFQATMGGASAAAEASLPTPRDSQAREVKKKQKTAAGLSRKLRSMIEEQQTNLDSLAATLQQELDQLSQYRAHLALSRTEHGRLLEELDKLAQQHRAAIELLQEEDVRVEAFVEEGQDVQTEMKAAQGQLQHVSTPQQAFSTIDATDHTTVEAEEWLQHSREKIPNSTPLSTSYKVVEATEAALEAARTVAEAMTDQHTSGHVHSTIMEAVEMLKERELKLVDLCSERLSKRLKGGQVFSVQKHEDGTRYFSKITRVGNKTLLHSLEQGSPPPGSCTLKMSEAAEGLDYHSILVFLDLSWPGILRHRVHIQVEADTPLTRQFVALCLGHTGLTYCSTKFLNVELGQNNIIVWLGDLSCQRAAKNYHLPPLQANQCGNSIIPSRGMLVAKTDLSNIAQNTQFGIVIARTMFNFLQSPQSGMRFTRGCNYNKLCYCLGHVQNAELSFVEATVNNNIAMKEIKVVDCGVVLSQRFLPPTPPPPPQGEHTHVDTPAAAHPVVGVHSPQLTGGCSTCCLTPTSTCGNEANETEADFKCSTDC